jgi:trimeric autotransporter adhesin
VKADKVDAEYVKADTVKADKVDAEYIKADTVKADKVDAEYVEADKIRAEHISTDTINAKFADLERIDSDNIYNDNNINTGTLTVRTDATVGGSLTVTGKATFHNDVQVDGNLNVNKSVTVGGPFTANGPAVFNNSVTVAPNQTINLGNNIVHGVAGPVVGTDAANKDYVDGAVDGAIDKAKQGTAVAIALGSITLQTGKNFAVGGNIGFFDGKEAFAFDAAVRLNKDITFDGAIGAGFGGGDVGGRVGFVAAF